MDFLTCAKNFAAAIATGRKLGIVAVATVDLIRLGPELLVHQRQVALEAQEAGLVPVLVFVGKILYKGDIKWFRYESGIIKYFSIYEDNYYLILLLCFYEICSIFK